MFAFSEYLPVFRSFGQQTEARVHDKIIMGSPNNRVDSKIEKMVYLARNSLAFSALLLLVDADCRHETVQHAHPNTEVVFLPLRWSSG